jgi:membrane protein required for colicin V production
MTAIDLAILAVMLVSGVLALMRGLTRELFSIISWGGAAFVTLWLFPPLQSTGRTLFGFIHTPWIADGITAVLLFLIALLALSFITGKLTDKVRGAEKPGPFDGTAGFIFGLARGFVLVCLLYQFYGWVAKDPHHDPAWIADSRFLPLIRDTNEAMLGLVSRAEQKIPENPTAGRPPPVDRGSANNDHSRRDSNNGYSNASRRGLDRLLFANRP